MTSILKAHPDFTVAYYPFRERPLSDSCWSVQTGPDGRVYSASCTEHTGGETVTMVRHPLAPDGQLDYLCDLDRVTGDRRDSGRATQCKIHYSLVPDLARGWLWGATHLSGPPKGETSYNPWTGWHDPQRSFRGSYLVALAVASGEVVRAELMIPKEGCRCLCFDPERDRLYALTYPRDHFVSYDLATRTLRDWGRLGSVNSQCLCLDSRGRVFTFADHGRMVRFDPERERLEELPIVFPHEPNQTPWHAVLYDAVREPRSGAFYLLPWKSRPHLARFWPDDGPNGRLEDLGRIVADCSPQFPVSLNQLHAGGLVLGPDGQLFLVKSVLAIPPDQAFDRQRLPPEFVSATPMLCRVDLTTGAVEELCSLAPNSHYVSRGAMDATGAMWFGRILAKPAGVFRVTLRQAPPPQLSQCLRLWG